MTQHFTIKLDDATAKHIAAMAAESALTIEEEIRVRIECTVGEERKPTPTGPPAVNGTPEFNLMVSRGARAITAFARHYPVSVGRSFLVAHRVSIATALARLVRGDYVATGHDD